MIVELSIKDFAIIDNIKINFHKGFNVLTGETGAGKSIIVEGISMILGQRASKEMVRTGKEKALLEGVFYLENPNKINSILEEYGIDSDTNNYLVISREIYSSGRTISRINGRNVTVNMLNRVTSNLVEIHGQHQHQSLLKVENHMKIIDAFGDSNFKKLMSEVKDIYEELQREKKKLKELSLNIMEREREIDLLKYQLNEIDSTNIDKIDEDEIISEYNKLNNIKEIAYNLGQAYNILNNEDFDSMSIIKGINRCITSLNSIANYDNTIKEFNNSLESINFELQELSRSIINYLENLVIDEERLKYLEEQIDTINRLKKKYGNTIQDIIKYRDSIENRLHTLLNNEEAINKSEKRIVHLEGKLKELCTKLTEERKKISKNIEFLITKELEDLNMTSVTFKVNFEKNEVFTAKGWDKIEFLISTNKGEELKPLSKIVSGGEMSRIMLAFKSILASYDNIPSLIFDEIDTGISGRTAQIVGEKIKSISKNHQVICISHLPQIAALGDSHFLIEKMNKFGKTQIYVKKLDYEERVNEISRLIAGVDLTETTKQHAREMLEMSKKLTV
ncbi:MAG: DNA repair protein RecN [Tissierellia bacterium]|nr:DNA repair protein RecN [Tissierellia bacterium]